jgi:peroxiredoxin
MGPYNLPENLPVPVDDGACDHLIGLPLPLPSVQLRSTTGGDVDLSRLMGLSVVYAYPRTGRPKEPDSPEWDAIPGARGCTPQSGGFRDHYDELSALKARVFGLSTQTTAYQQEAVRRLRLPFPLLSDADLLFTTALKLPTFQFAPYPGQSPVHLKRLTLVIHDGRIIKTFYPVFPPDRDAESVCAWLADHLGG